MNTKIKKAYAKPSIEKRVKISTVVSALDSDARVVAKPLAIASA
ncbi:MAG: hypothetical protein ABJ081_10050 [Hyphomicrobiales bacterium]